LCGSATGTVTVTDPLGTSYMYKNNNSDWQSGVDFTGIAAGAGYNILVKDANGCISSAPAGCETTTQQRKKNQQVKEITQASEKQKIVRDMSATIDTDPSIDVKAYPNPFKHEVSLYITVHKAGNGLLEIYNMQGVKIKSIYQGYFNQGIHRYRIQVPEGNRQFVYLLNIEGEKLSGQLMQLSE
jgi:hypothetical protein